MKFKKVLVLVVFLSAFLCACHANYSAQKTNVQENEKTASEDMPGRNNNCFETTFKI